MTNIDDYKGALRILVFLLIKDIPITGFHTNRGSQYEVAGQGAVNRTLNALVRLELIEQYSTNVGITKVLQINNTLTDKGRDVAHLVVKIQERLES